MKWKPDGGSRPWSPAFSKAKEEDVDMIVHNKGRS